MRHKHILDSAAVIFLVTFFFCQLNAGETVMRKGISTNNKTPKEQYLTAARQAANWLESLAKGQPTGLVWPDNPEKVAHKSLTALVPGTSLYSHSPGVILFFLEAYHVTGETHFLHTACRGADFLLTTIPEKTGENTDFGLYTGISGTTFVLEECYRASSKTKYLRGVQKCVELIKTNSKTIGSGKDWTKYTDIISGSAGTGLTLLYLSKHLNRPDLLTLAKQAGHRLIELAIPDKDGLKWKIFPEYEKIMPNFSHGTAGIAYFLATLYQRTHQKKFLDAALAGARFLLSIATQKNDSCLIFHHDNGGENLFYLGWCHGPPGTARLFYRLYEITGDNFWKKWFKKSANAILRSGLPEKQTEGFWNNVGRCCGSAGVAEFMLDVHRATAGQKMTDTSPYLSFARLMTGDILKKATPTANGKGLKWSQAEHRVKPELVQAQTGLMQGAAGIGLWLLKLYAYENGKKETIRFPDTPF